MGQTPILHAANFEEMIDRRGRTVSWQEAITCSCWNLDSGQPSYACNACSGKGFIYQAPSDVKALVTSVTLNKEYADMAGVFDVGDAVMTVPKRIPVRTLTGALTSNFTDNPMFDIGVNDRITLLDDEFKTSEILIKGESIGHRSPDTLLNDQITRIKGVSYFDRLTGLETKYKVTTDYVLNGNTIEWIAGGSAPTDGAQYSVTYAHRPVYTVIATLPKPRHQDGQDFPRYVALRYLSGAVDRP